MILVISIVSIPSFISYKAIDCYQQHQNDPFSYFQYDTTIRPCDSFLTTYLLGWSTFSTLIATLTFMTYRRFFNVK